MIRFVDVHKSFPSRQTHQNHEVLRGINFEIPAGKLTVILGPSGTGKSVLLKHMIGLILPDCGQVMVDGINIGSLKEQELNHFRKKFGMLFQGGALFDSMTVEENVAFPMREHTSWSAEEINKKVRQKLAQVGLEESFAKLPSELSGGMRKRVGLARAIALEPTIILYDEPTTGLDPLMKDSINRLILDLHQSANAPTGNSSRDSSKMTSIVISHDIESTFQIADFVAMLNEGKIIAQGTPGEFKKSEHPFIKKFLKRE